MDQQTEARELFGSFRAKPRHSKEFLAILEQASPDTAIRAVTHAKPILVFWITPDGKVLDAGDAHHDNPPHGDRSVLSNPTHKGHLRGRAALFGDVVYVVVYGDNKVHHLSVRQARLLKQAASRILSELIARGVPETVASAAQFIQEDGEDIHI